MVVLALLVFTYLLASVPFGLVVTTLVGIDRDIRAAGSGNIGATNVARVAGWRRAWPVLVLDVGKGALPVAVAMWAWPYDPELAYLWGSLVGLVAFLGHCFPVYLEFHGGKGVATGAGALLALSPGPTFLAAAVWTGLLVATGKSSVAAIGATLSMVGFAWWLSPQALPVAALLGVGVLLRHIANIRRIVRGQEPDVIRPVRWGRGDDESVDDLLAQSPGGGAGTAVWRPAGDEVTD